MSKSSGATNRQRHREAEQGRRLEEDHAPRRLANLPPEQQEMARRLMDRVLLGELRDPDALAPESE